MTYEELLNIFEEHKNKKNTELVEILGRKDSWISQARKFIYAKDEDKEKMKDKNSVAKALYKKYLDYKIKQEVSKNKEQHTENKEVRIELLKNALKRSLTFIARQRLIIKHITEENNLIKKDYAEIALDVNRLQNEKSELLIKVSLLEKEVKYYKYLYYAIFLISFSVIFILFLRT